MTLVIAGSAAPSQPNRPQAQLHSIPIRSYALHGVRLSAAVALALFTAYSLELDNAFWAGITAAVACQPSLGNSLQKGRVRLIGTIIGGGAIVILTAAVPQSRVGMFVGLALWIGLCGFLATVLRNVASYGAALAGFTAAVLFSDVVISPNETFLLALTRMSEIILGIGSAALVLIATDLGTARVRLGDAFASAAEAVAGGFADALAGGAESPATRAWRRQLIRRVIALDGLIDEAIGEASDLRGRAGTLRHGLEGLFSALSAWRGVANHLDAVGRAAAEAELIELSSIVRRAAKGDWRRNPAGVRAACSLDAQRVLALQVDDASRRFMVDQVCQGLMALERVANAVCLTVMPGTEWRPRRASPLMLPDILPALINGLRAVIAVLSAEAFWVATNWSGGQAVVTFAAVAVTVFSPSGESAYWNVLGYAAGTVVAFILAAAFNFVVLPGVDGFVGLALALSCVLVPLGALSAGSWRRTFSAALVINFLAILSPSNQPTYDVVAFFNSGAAVITGTVFGCFCMCLLPRLPSSWQTGRLLTLTLRDLRRLSVRRRWLGSADWTSLVSCRLEAMPAEATEIELAQLVAALSVGEAIIRLRDWRQMLAAQTWLDQALSALAAGDVTAVRYWLSGLSAVLASDREPTDVAALRGQAAAFVISEALIRHAAFFEATPTYPPTAYKRRT